MDKKKAVKLATASAVAASAFVAANPHASQAATDVATVVSQAKAQFKAAYYAYSHTVTETGKLPNISDVYAAYNKAKQAYANAVAVVNKAGGAKKDAYLADLQATYETYVFKANPKSGEARVATYIDAYNYATKLDAMRQELKAAVDAKDLKKAEELYHKISYELKTRTVILDRVYGQTTRELLRSQFKAEAQKLRDSLIYDITVAMKAREAQDAVKAGNLDKAKAALDQVNQYVSKVTDAFKAELQKAAQDANAAYEAALTPKVESVSAINAEEILVTFNKNVDSKTASDVANYELKINGGSRTSDIDKIKVDGKTALIRLKDGVVFNSGDKFVLQVKDSVKDYTGKQIERFASDEITFNVTTAPKIVESTYNGTSLQLKFDRPVGTSVTLIKVDGVALNSKSLVAVDDDAPGNYVYTVSLTDAEQKLAGKVGTHEVVIFDLVDTKSVLPNKASVATSTYTVTQDAEAPFVKAVKALNANKFFIELSESGTTVTNASFTIKKGNYTFAVGGNNTQLAADASSGSEKNKVYYEAGTLDGKPGYYVVITEPGTGELNPLYGKDENSVTLNVTFENYKDSSNFIGAKYEGTVTLSKDTNKPQVDKTNIDTANKKLLVDFNGDLSAAPSTSDIVVRNKDGVIITPTSVGLGSSDRSVVEITLSDVKDEPYTVEFKEGKIQYAVVKNSVVGYNLNTNKNDAFTVTVKSTANNFFKYVEFTANGTAPTVVTGAKNVIEIKYGVEMGTSALDVANYSLDGKPLPTGTKIDFFGDKKTVRITLPEGTFVTTTSYKLTIKTDVMTKDGVRIVGDLQTKTPYETVLTLTDNVKPVLQEVKYLIVNDTDTTTKKLLVKFSEVLKSGVNFDTDDFKVTVQGSTQAIASISNLKADDEYLVIELSNTVNVNQSATIEIVPEGPSNTAITVVDLADNKATGSATATSTTKDAKGN